MNPRVRDLWAGDLENCPVEQGTGALRQIVNGVIKDCCLARLCELYRLEHPDAPPWKLDDIDNRQVFLGAHLTLPMEVQEWAGLLASDPTIGYESATELNDNLGKTFPEIADLIRKNL